MKAEQERHDDEGPGNEPPPDPRVHPHTEQLERLLRGGLSRTETRPVVRHLLISCPECVSVTRRLWALGDPA